jgi:hypothetical protein
MSRKRLVDEITSVMRSELDTWGSDQVIHMTPCDVKRMLWEIVRTNRVSIQDRHLARYVLRFVQYPSLDQFNSYLTSLGVDTVTKTWLVGITRARSIVPTLCKRYAAIGPCSIHRKLRARRFL